MIIKLAALGALGYLGYRYLSGQQSEQRQSEDEDRVALAGGPLSESARVQHSPAAPSP